MSNHPDMHSSPDRREPDDKTSRAQAWGIAAEGSVLVGTLLLGLYLGHLVDKRFGTLPWGMIAGAVLGIIAGLYGFLKRFL